MDTKIIYTQKTLSPTQINLADFVINPYRGCEFGCLYCYSQENKNIKKVDFSKFLGIKINSPEILEKELRFKNPKRILLGSTTECFQYQELRYGLTKKIIEILNQKNIAYTILTKSHLVSEYIDLIAKNRQNKIYFTFNFGSDKIIKAIEKKSSSIRQRLNAIGKIVKKNIPLRIHIGPFIPYLSSLDEILKLLPKGIKEIDIELYHKKQGNFNKITSQIKKILGPKSYQDFKSIYASKDNYCAFSADLRKYIIALKSNFRLKFYYIVPDFDSFYNQYLNYEESLL